MRKIRTAVAFVFSMSSMIAHAQTNAGYEPARTILQSSIHYDIHADGSYVRDEFESIRVNNDIGIQSFGQMPFLFSSSLQDLEVIEAYTTTKDGRRIDVSPEKIFVQQSPQSVDTPMFGDTKIKNIVFPAVEAGATLTYHVRRIQKNPLFPGAFSAIETFDRTDEFKTARITVEAPESLKLFIDAAGLQAGNAPKAKEGTKVWQWSLTNTVAHAPEPGSVGTLDFSPRVAVTSFPSYDEVARAYLDRARNKARVTPAIQRLADEITDGISDKRAQAEAIYRWVSRNIRYVAIFLDFGGVVPHDAEAVSNAEYGDCKDHVTLLETLLAAKQIRSAPVLVNATNNYWLPGVAAAPGVFNHVITYLHDFDMYVDSTAQFASFGVLPPTEGGKIALLTDDGNGKAKQVVLPEAQSGSRNAIRVRTNLKVLESGDVEGESRINNEGISEFLARAQFSVVPRGAERQLANMMLARGGQHGSGIYKFGNPRDLAKAFDYATSFTLPRYVQLPGAGAMTIPSGLNTPIGIPFVVSTLALEKRDFPKPCGASSREELTSISLPANMRIISTPKPTKIDNALGHYESSYVQDGQSLTVRRQLDIKAPPTCNSADYARLRQMAEAIAHDLRTQIGYR